VPGQNRAVARLGEAKERELDWLNIPERRLPPAYRIEEGAREKRGAGKL